jgi:hypothetical protein
MANNGVPDTVVSAWAGHADLSFTKRTYVHPDPESLRAGSKKRKKLLGRPISTAFVRSCGRQRPKTTQGLVSPK